MSFSSSITDSAAAGAGSGTWRGVDAEMFSTEERRPEDPVPLAVVIDSYDEFCRNHPVPAPVQSAAIITAAEPHNPVTGGGIPMVTLSSDEEAENPVTGIPEPMLEVNVEAAVNKHPVVNLSSDDEGEGGNEASRVLEGGATKLEPSTPQRNRGAPVAVVRPLPSISHPARGKGRRARPSLRFPPQLDCSYMSSYVPIHLRTVLGPHPTVESIENAMVSGLCPHRIGYKLVSQFPSGWGPFRGEHKTMGEQVKWEAWAARCRAKTSNKEMEALAASLSPGRLSRTTSDGSGDPSVGRKRMRSVSPCGEAVTEVIDDAISSPPLVNSSAISASTVTAEVRQGGRIRKPRQGNF